MIKKTTNSLNYNDWISPVIPVDCSTLQLVGVYCIILFLISIISNSLLILILIRNRKKLLTSVNIFIFALAILSLIPTLIELPLLTITAFKCKYNKKNFLDKNKINSIIFN